MRERREERARARGESERRERQQIFAGREGERERVSWGDVTFSEGRDHYP